MLSHKLPSNAPSPTAIDSSTAKPAVSIATNTEKRASGGSMASLDPEWACPQCSVQCSSVEEFQIHLQSHAEDSAMDQDKAMLSCPYCAEIFVEEEVLELHIEQAHTVESVNKCQLCGLSFLDQDDLTLHIKSHETLTMLKESQAAAAAMLSSGSSTSSSSTSRDSMAHLQKKKRLENMTRSLYPVKKEMIGKIGHSDGSRMEAEGVNKLDCPYCSQKGFSNLAGLSVHIRTVHTGLNDNLITCHICHAGYSSSDKLSSHMEKEHPQLLNPDPLEIKFPCDYCVQEFNSPTLLKQHKEAVHQISELLPKPVDVVYCSQCTMGFPHIYALAEHMHHIHGYNKTGNKASPASTPSKLSPGCTSVASNSSPDPIKVSPGADLKFPSAGELTYGLGVTRESFLCDHCNSTFHDLKSYQVHLKNHVDSSFVKYTCTECQAEFTSQEQLESHVFVHFLALTTEYGCTSCLKLFSKPDELQKHLMDIHAHHLYRCSLCKEVFDSKVNIQVHFAIKHSNECKLYKCTTCTMVFRSEMEWQLHVKVHHLGIQDPYRCFFCKESFGSEAEMQRHLATHKKQFPCPLCEEAFHVEYLLDKHLQTKHCPEGGQKGAQVTADGAVKVKVKSEPVAPDVSLDGFRYSSPPAVKEPKLSLPISDSSPVKPPRMSPKVSHRNSLSPKPTGPPQPCKGDLIYKCEICDVKFSDEGTLNKHRMHDHSISPEMQMAFQKSLEAGEAKNVKLSSKSGGSSGGSSDKFSQLCVYCNQTFKTKSELEKHMKTHVTPSNQKCNICDEIFPSASILAEHKLTHCKVVKGNMCVVCKVAMKSEEQFYSHSQQHGFQGTNMQCVVCRQTLASMLELQMHGKHHFQNTANFYTCCVCLKSFDAKENLISKLNTNGRTYYVCKPCYHGETSENLTCPTCGARCESKVQLESHMLTHRKSFQCIKCQQSFGSEYEIQLHVATHLMQEGNVHECRICNRIFESPSKLQCHLIEHTFEGMEIKCYVCGMLFTQVTGIQMHVLEHGVNARQFSCTQCPQKFFFSAELQNHLYNHGLRVPVATNNYQCPECPKSFDSIAQLANHHKVHEKKDSVRLPCSLCSDTFPSMMALQQHFFLVHSGLEKEKPMTNATVGKTPVKCAECHKEFPSLSSLQGHMRVHSSAHKAKQAALASSGQGNVIYV